MIGKCFNVGFAGFMEPMKPGLRHYTVLLDEVDISFFDKAAQRSG